MGHLDEDHEGQGETSDRSSTRLAYTNVVPPPHADGESIAEAAHQQQKPYTARDIQNTSYGPQNETTGDRVHKRNLCDTAVMLISSSTRASTKTKYRSIERQWLQHCVSLNIDPELQTTNVFINFLAVKYEKNLKYGTLRSYIPALTKYIKQVDMNKVRSLLRGVYNLRPPVAKYTSIWDVNLVLAYIGCMITNNIMDLSMKLTTLLMILSGNRVNMLSHFSITNLFITNEEATFVFDKALKHSRPNFNIKPMVFRAFPEQPFLCPVKTIWDYLNIREDKTADTGLFITTTKPHRAATPDTIARWIKNTLALAGIDTGRFSAHSCRASATSAAHFQGISLSTIMKSASWTNVGTFKTHYLKDIEERQYPQQENFGKKLLTDFIVQRDNV